MAASFRERLEAMVETLRAHPDVEVLGFRFGSPAASILEFYAAHNGVFLEWGLRGSTYTRTDPYDFPDYSAPPGCIHLLPIAVAFQRDWQTNDHVNELLPGQEELFDLSLGPDPGRPRRMRLCDARKPRALTPNVARVVLTAAR